MFVVLLRFAEQKSRAAQFMDAHKEWIQRGFDEGVFLLSGSVKPNLGGAILAHSTTRPELEARVSADPFVVGGVVAAEIFELAPSKSVEQMSFLLRADA